MANLISANPLVIDTVGSVKTQGLHIIGIEVCPSAANWVVDLHDADGGNVVYKGVGSTKDNGSSVYIGDVNGLYATTLTNVTAVMIYTE